MKYTGYHSAKMVNNYGNYRWMQPQQIRTPGATKILPASSWRQRKPAAEVRAKSTNTALLTAHLDPRSRKKPVRQSRTGLKT
jgi:hypothetical protein